MQIEELLLEYSPIMLFVEHENEFAKILQQRFWALIFHIDRHSMANKDFAQNWFMSKELWMAWRNMQL